MTTVWRVRGKSISLSRPVIVGIVNVTPDSFSDGGRTFSADHAVAHALRLVDEGADVVDIGGESTRPGAQPVHAEEELRRILPVIERVRGELPSVPISVDTVKASVAQAALDAGADIINDVSALRLDPRMAEICAAAGCGVVLMHSRGSVQEMAKYDLANYSDVVAEVRAELDTAVTRARAAGISDESIVLDPGFGFSKRTEHSLQLLRSLEAIVALGFPVLVGLSRKRMVGELSGIEQPAERDHVTAALNVAAFLHGARLFRVHAVAMSRVALDVVARAYRAEDAGAGQ
jgi:dihydropteroate synthase